MEKDQISNNKPFQEKPNSKKHKIQAQLLSQKKQQYGCPFKKKQTQKQCVKVQQKELNKMADKIAQLESIFSKYEQGKEGTQALMQNIGEEELNAYLDQIISQNELTMKEYDEIQQALDSVSEQVKNYNEKH